MTKDNIIDRVFITTSTDNDGMYAVQIFKNGTWHCVVIDDRIPCAETADGAVAPAFACSTEGNELWVMLLEKAMAKFYGSYQALEGGLTVYGLVDLTGGEAEEIDLQDEATLEQVYSGDMWHRLLEYHKAGFLIGAESPAGSDTDVSPMGIVQGHAYAVLRVVEEVDHRGTHQLVQLRNPWGNTEWQGEWSDRDFDNWTLRMRAKLGYNPLDEGADNDGIFFMSFQALLDNFRAIFVCRLFMHDLAPTGQWHRYVATGSWSGRTAGGAPCPGNVNAVHNPQYYLHPVRRAKVFISVTQREWSPDKADKYC